MLKPSENVKKAKLTWTVSKPTLSALKKKLFTGPLGKILLSMNDNVEPIIPPRIMPKIILPIFLLAILLLFCSKAKH